MRSSPGPSRTLAQTCTGQAQLQIVFATCCKGALDSSGQSVTYTLEGGNLSYVSPASKAKVPLSPIESDLPAGFLDGRRFNASYTGATTMYIYVAECSALTLSADPLSAQAQALWPCRDLSQPLWHVDQVVSDGSGQLVVPLCAQSQYDGCAAASSSQTCSMPALFCNAIPDGCPSPPLPPSPPPPPQALQPTPSPSSSSSSNGAVIGGVVGGVVAVLLLLFAAFTLFVARRRRRRAAELRKAELPLVARDGSGGGAGTGLPDELYKDDEPAALDGGVVPPPDGSFTNTSVLSTLPQMSALDSQGLPINTHRQSLVRSVADTQGESDALHVSGLFGGWESLLMTKTVNGNTTLSPGWDSEWDARQFCRQLQQMADNSICFGKHYSLTGEVIDGGQGSVAFATVKQRGMHGVEAVEVAIKFHFNLEVFKNEAKLVKNEELEFHLPHVVEISRTKPDLFAPNGVRFPPYIILPRGEPLDMFIKTRKPDSLQSIMILIHLAEKLAAMHEAGWAHRDVKPANSIWLPVEHEWNVIDFGCAAKIGDTSQIMCTLRYAAPEIVRAILASESTMVVTAAVDVWALGVIAHQLLTGSDALSKMSAEDIYEALQGRGLMPWEQDVSFKIATPFAMVVKQMLARDPADRPPMSEVLQGWRLATGIAA